MREQLNTLWPFFQQSAQGRRLTISSGEPPDTVLMKSLSRTWRGGGDGENWGRGKEEETGRKGGDTFSQWFNANSHHTTPHHTTTQYVPVAAGHSKAGRY